MELTDHGVQCAVAIVVAYASGFMAHDALDRAAVRWMARQIIRMQCGLNSVREPLWFRFWRWVVGE